MNSTPPDAVHTFKHDAMNCTFQIILVADKPSATHAANAAWEELDRLEADLSRFNPTSDVTRINNSAGHRAVRVGLDTWKVLTMAHHVWLETGGAFDVTWTGGGSVPFNPAHPPVQLDHNEQKASVAAGRRIDLGAIGKGYALDIMALMLQHCHIEKALLTSGESTVLALGPGESETPWKVALRDPNNQAKEIGFARLRNVALSGSGMQLHGAHIIDPRTGRPATGKLATWAAAPSGAVSDALSTAFMVMPPESIQNFCSKFEDVVAAVLGANHQLLQCGQSPGLTLSIGMSS